MSTPELEFFNSLSGQLEIELTVPAEPACRDLCGSNWPAGSRSDDASRAVAAYLARREYGYPAADVARALGYRGHRSVNSAIARVASRNRQLEQTLKDPVKTFADD